MWAYALDLSLPVSVSQSMQDCICGDISGAVIANKKLSVIRNRENNTEVGQTSMAPTIREAGIVINNGSCDLEREIMLQ